MWISQGSLLGVVLAYLVFLFVVATLAETGSRWMARGRLRTLRPFARAARDRAEQRLRPQEGEEVDAARATRALSRAQGRLQTAARRPGGA